MGMQRIVIAALCAALAPAVARADAIEDFYKGRQMRAIVGYPAGSDYDNWMRLLTRHWGRFIPGRPNIIVQNMPGAGQIIATNYLANSAEKDGSVVGMTDRAHPYLSLLGDANIRVDMRSFNWIGSPEQTNRGCFAIAGAPAQTAQELFSKEIIVGGAGAGSSVSNTPVLLNRLLGMKFKMIEGYSGSEAIMLATERGELHGLCQTVGGIRHTRPGWIEQGKLKVLFTLEHDPVPDLKAPTIYEFAKTDEQKAIISLYDSSLELGRPLVAPPGVPAERVEVLRRSFDVMMADAEFLSDAAKLHYEITPRKGERLQQIVADIMATPKPIIERSQELLK
jgi:tripartite-type tricarboxylate transporter receptor subunit TctC